MSVLDASALLAFLQDERGAEMVEQALKDGAYMSAVNLGELLSKVSDQGSDPDDFHKQLMRSGTIGKGVTIVPCDEEDAVAISKIRRSSKQVGLSLGDRACIALGIKLGMPILTTDRLWSKLNIEADIKVIR